MFCWLKVYLLYAHCVRLMSLHWPTLSMHELCFNWSYTVVFVLALQFFFSALSSLLRYVSSDQSTFNLVRLPFQYTSFTRLIFASCRLFFFGRRTHSLVLAPTQFFLGTKVEIHQRSVHCVASFIAVLHRLALNSYLNHF